MVNYWWLIAGFIGLVLAFAFGTLFEQRKPDAAERGPGDLELPPPAPPAELKQDNDVEEDPEFVHLLVPARDVPDGDVVLKRGGSFEYRLWRKLKVFDAPGKEMAGDDCVFLVSGKGVIAALQIHRMVLWKVTPEQAIRYLEDRIRDV